VNTLKNRRIKIHTFAATLLLLGILAVLPVSAGASTIIGVSNDQTIYTIDSDTSVATQIHAGQAGKGSYAVAQCSDGMVYFTDIFSTGVDMNLYRFNPATPATAPVSLGVILEEMARGTCHPTTGKLYFMKTGPGDIFEIVAGPTSFTITQQTLTPPGTTPPGPGGGGDIAFDSLGTLYLLDGENDYEPPNRLWTINLTTLQIENVGAVTGFPGTSRIHGLAFDATGKMLIALDNRDPAQVLYTAPKTGGAATPVASGNPLGVYMKDLASNVAPPAQPSITVVKSSTAFSDPFNGTSTPKRIPGGVVTYNIITTNSGQGSVDNDEVILTDPIPTNTDLVVTDFGGVGSGPIAFTDGTTTSGMTYTFTSLSSTTDDVRFFTDSACTAPGVEGTTPVANTDGVDPLIRCVRINPKGIFAADAVVGSPSPNFTINFRVRMR